MSERDNDEFADDIFWQPESKPDFDPDAERSKLYEGASSSGIVRAWVSGSLEFSHVTIAHLRSPDSLGDDIVEAVNAAMGEASATYAMSGMDAAIAERVATFETEIERLDRSIDAAAAWIEGVHSRLMVGTETDSDAGAGHDIDSEATSTK